MCGIFGIIASSKANLDQNDLRTLILSFFKLSERRGKDASGVLAVGAKSFDVYKSPIRASKMIQTKYFGEILEASLKRYAQGESFCIAGHTRMVTGGSESASHNNQPVLKNGMALLHNGIIVNEGCLWSKNERLRKDFEVDSEILLSLIDEKEAEESNLLKSLSEALSVVKGANTFALFRDNARALYLSSSNRSLYFLRIGKDVTLFSSEKSVLTNGIKSVSKLSNQAHVSTLIHADPTLIYGVNINNATIEEYSSADVEIYAKGRTVRESRTIKDLTPKANQGAASVLANSLSRITQESQLNLGKIKDLKRCSRCVLPETFPNLTFNSEGVCRYCTSFEETWLMGLEELTDISRNLRTPNREDCLIPLSGGRDSCYALHFVKNELGLNPVAFTYDWGFVTDQARRNISRICGELNVEHILVAADIRRKRQNVKKNVAAWLAKPDISMIPLFMAGDKFFFKYASMLRREMKLNSIIFSQNALERTDFKTGFANVDDTSKHKKIHGLSAYNQIRLVLHYTKRFLANPKYINDTLGETALAFAYYYLKQRDYLLLFDYIDWEEEKIISTIKEKYDWEGSVEGKSTWRIGDGTAPFYNYIYLKHSGFCENDTFRSNQIRAGLLDRQTALDYVLQENVIGAESLKWYFDTINIDAQSALKTINSAFPNF
ncbi:MAG: hypothetical protein ACJ0SM_09025 [Arenicellales bacterium]